MAIKWLYLEACSIINDYSNVFEASRDELDHASINSPWPMMTGFFQEMVTLNFHNGLVCCKRIGGWRMVRSNRIYRFITSHRLLAYASAHHSWIPKLSLIYSAPHTVALSSSISIRSPKQYSRICYDSECTVLSGIKLLGEMAYLAAKV